MSYNRRRFIEDSMTVTTALFLASLDGFGLANHLPGHKTKGFDLKIMAPYWGFDGNVTDFCQKAKKMDMMV